MGGHDGKPAFNPANRRWVNHCLALMGTDADLNRPNLFLTADSADAADINPIDVGLYPRKPRFN